jgi:hypothetical protein|tara:strand:+ start:596 stop:787 length:192 start_codon:yes stop_codon:yes gene_type:complete
METVFTINANPKQIAKAIFEEYPNGEVDIYEIIDEYLDEPLDINNPIESELLSKVTEELFLLY